MRITNGMMVDQFLTDSNSSLARLSKYTRQVDSTKKINSISDDAQATVMALKARNRLSSLAAYQNALNTSKSYLTEAENATANINDILQSTYELMESANSGAKTHEDLITIGEEISNLKEELLSVANSSIGTVFLFGGNTTTRPPFSVEANGALMYNGINLSMISASESYDDCAETVKEHLTEIVDLMGQLDSCSDYTAQNSLGLGILDNLEAVIANTNNAVEHATEFSKYVTDFDETKIDALKSLSNNLTTIKNALSSELSQELAEVRPGQPGNDFSIEDMKNSLADLSAMLSNDPPVIDALFEDCQLPVPDDMKDLMDEENGVKSQLKVASATFMDITANGLELLGTGNSNFYCLLEKCTKICSGELDSSLMTGVIGELQNAMSENSTQRTSFGASLERVSMLNSRYETSNITYTQMKSDAEDADLAEAITNMTTAKTVYNAALASGAQLVQTSLLDFLR